MSQRVAASSASNHPLPGPPRGQGRKRKQRDDRNDPLVLAGLEFMRQPGEPDNDFQRRADDFLSMAQRANYNLGALMRRHRFPKRGTPERQRVCEAGAVQAAQEARRQQQEKTEEALSTTRAAADAGVDVGATGCAAKAVVEKGVAVKSS
jgi:hypothetical protein